MESLLLAPIPAPSETIAFQRLLEALTYAKGAVNQRDSMNSENVRRSETAFSFVCRTSDAKPSQGIPVELAGDAAPDREKMDTDRQPQPVGKASHREVIAKWKGIVAEFQKPNAWRASWQLLNTIGGYAALWYLMYLSLAVSWWLTIPLAILAGGFLVRVFIICHDCGHGSFFRSRLANDIWGFITGVLTFTPYSHWRWEHSVHHATAGHLERRGMGDIWTLTVEEYLESSRWKKFSYRLARNPVLLFVIAPLVIFVVLQRFPSAKAKPRERASVWIMNGALLGMAAVLIAIFGFIPWLIIQLVVMAVAGSAGVWLFYVQHQFEDVYWERGENWDFTAAALQGSSFYKLPKILQWFSGSIGYHHIHHLSPRIPNYHLERCHRSDPMFRQVPPLTLWSSLKSLTFRLWDEKTRKLIGFRQLHRQNRPQQARGARSSDMGGGDPTRG